MLAIREKPQTVGGNRLKPIERHGLTVMSIGFLIEEETPMIWQKITMIDTRAAAKSTKSRS